MSNAASHLVTGQPQPPGRPYPAWYEQQKKPASVGDLRISHADREPVVEQIKDAYAQGRLDKAEFDQRLNEALSARTRAELGVALRDLPGDMPPPTPMRSPMPTAVPAINERVWGALGHLAGIVTSFLGPLVLYVLTDRRLAHAREQLAEAVNFQLTLLLVTIVTFGVGGIVYAVAWVVSIVAAAQALSGDRYRYPLTLRLLR